MTDATRLVPQDLRDALADLNRRIAASDVWAIIDDWLDLHERYNEATADLVDDDLAAMLGAECGFREASTRLMALASLLEREPGTLGRGGMETLRALHPDALDPQLVGTRVAAALNEKASDL